MGEGREIETCVKGDLLLARPPFSKSFHEAGIAAVGGGEVKKGLERAGCFGESEVEGL